MSDAFDGGDLARGGKQRAGRWRKKYHGMRKLLHLVFAVWKTDRPFDPEHYA